jgi:hypothetical protein
MRLLAVIIGSVCLAVPYLWGYSAMANFVANSAFTVWQSAELGAFLVLSPFGVIALLVALMKKRAG